MLTSYLAYLDEKGCVRMERKKQFDITLVTIRAKGLDVLDGRVECVGVGVKEC